MENTDLTHELKSKVESFVDRNFNYIHIEVVKASLGDTPLEELIEPLNSNYDDFFMNYNKYDEYKEWCLENGYSLSDSDAEEVKEEFSSQDGDFESYKTDIEGNNYPMWNTIFEIRDAYWTDITKYAEECGFGVINGTDYLNNMLFVAGAGYSFYAQHWIPLYLKLFPEETKKYKDVNYEHL